MSDPRVLNTVVVGGGHCGLNLGCWLAERGDKSYIVLERGDVLNAWKHNRWDAFVMNTPMKYSRLHKQSDDVPDTAMGRPLTEDIARWEAHIEKVGVKYREKCAVTSVTLREDGKFVTDVTCADGDVAQYVSSNVVACNGNYDHLYIPECHKALHPSIKQLQSDRFRNETELQDGAVLIVGGGQSGVQLADLLLSKGKKVYLCTSRVPGSVRSYRGEDVFFWMERTGFSDLTKEALTRFPDQLAMALRYGRIPVVGSTKPISPFSLHRLGAKLLGALENVGEDGLTITLKPNRSKNIGVCAEAYQGFPDHVEEWLKATGEEEQFGPPNGFPEPEWEPVEELLDDPGPRSLNLTDEGITNVLWATGYRPDFSWIRIDAVHEGFDAVNKKPDSLETSVPGFFFAGFHWLNTLQSGNVLGFDKDHEIIVEKLR